MLGIMPPPAAPPVVRNIVMLLMLGADLPILSRHDASGVQWPRTFYTDLNSLICELWPQAHLPYCPHTGRRVYPVIAWHTPHGPHERQRQADQLPHGDLNIWLPSSRVDLCDPPLPRIIHTRIGHHHLLRLLNAEQVVIHPYFHPLAPPSRVHIETEVVEPHLAILPDGARQLAEA